MNDEYLWKSVKSVGGNYLSSYTLREQTFRSLMFRLRFLRADVQTSAKNELFLSVSARALHTKATCGNFKAPQNFELPWNFHWKPFRFDSEHCAFYSECCVYTLNMCRNCIYAAFRMVRCIIMRVVVAVFSAEIQAADFTRFSTLTPCCAGRRKEFIGVNALAKRKGEAVQKVALYASTPSSAPIF